MRATNSVRVVATVTDSQRVSQPTAHRLHRLHSMLATIIIFCLTLHQQLISSGSSSSSSSGGGSSFVSADETTQTYQIQDPIALYYNKIGPYHNPQETYQYYSLPFCTPEVQARAAGGGKQQRISDNAARAAVDSSLAVILDGDDLTDSGVTLHFRVNEENTKLCDMNSLSAADASEFIAAVKNHYWYQMYIDELPVWGMVGEYMLNEVPLQQQQRREKIGGDQVSSDTRSISNSITKSHIAEQAYLYTHKDFTISYNGEHIIQVNMTSENPKLIAAGNSYSMTYSVQWMATTTIEFEHRFDRYLDFDFFEHKIHWFSIFNSFMMVIFVVGLVALVLMRTLNSDYQRYTSAADADDDLDASVVDESGWKQIHGDVFRSPARLMLYSALVGTGSQLLAVAMCLLALMLLMTVTFYDDRGSLLSALLLTYNLMFAVAGYTSAQIFKRNGGTKWKPNMLLTVSLLPAFTAVVLLLLNTVAVLYSSSASLSFTTLLYIALIWVFVSCPLTLLGTLIGRSRCVVGDHPCRINALKRPIPHQYNSHSSHNHMHSSGGSWFSAQRIIASPVALMLLSGVLPFSSIFIEMYFIFASFWNYKFYYVYGFMFLVLSILTIVTVCVTIVSTYLLLNSEDYRWHWNAFLCGGSTAIYVFLYSVYYFICKTHMHGALQTSYYFGYMLLLCAALFMLCGTIGYIGASIFVNRIYRFIKSD